MNRLVLIGNGFDLAHGLKTSYKDFITDYLYNALNTFYLTRNFCDNLISISYNTSQYFDRKEQLQFDYEELVKNLQWLGNVNFVTVKYTSKFFKKLLDNCSTANWVDIENEYFKLLKSFNTERGWRIAEVTQLNYEFDFIKNKLETYLLSLNCKAISKRHYSRLICAPIDMEEIVLAHDIDDFNLEEVHILNFNYTATFNSYYNDCSKSVKNISFNFIHGELGNNENPIIFGFGDEHDKQYISFEDYNNNILFKHIKSFAYFKTRNYHNLIRFTDNKPYQVLILGHSCGLSDRTMLKQVFEHENCRSIKILHYCRPDGSNDHLDKTYEIARHFSDKGLMRKKIVSFNALDCM